jgi:ribonucleoside-diphosphate reductase alpha chain
VPLALKRLGYERDEVQAIVEHIDENDTIEGAPGLADEHLPVFDCAFKPAKGQRSIEWLGHLKMLSATQPFISGAISKTINMPEDATVDDIAGAYMEGWKLGLKAVAIYRDGSKRSQPLSTKKDEAKAATRPEERRAVRVKLADERQAVTHKFSVAEHEGYITVGLYENGQPGEIFLTMAKQGSTVSGLVDAFATVVSIALQYGVPLATLVDKLSHTRFEPAGLTKNPEIPFAKSITDYISRWLASRFLSRDEKMAAGVILRDGEPAAEHAPPVAAAPAPAAVPAAAPAAANGHPAANGHANGNGNGSGKGAAEPSHPQITFIADSPSCHECGAIMVRNGSCYKCLNCGSTSGCS